MSIISSQAQWQCIDGDIYSTNTYTETKHFHLYRSAAEAIGLAAAWTGHSSYRTWVEWERWGDSIPWLVQAEETGSLSDWVWELVTSWWLEEVVETWTTKQKIVTWVLYIVSVLFSGLSIEKTCTYPNWDIIVTIKL